MKKQIVVAGTVVTVALLLILTGLFWSSSSEQSVNQEPVNVDISNDEYDDKNVAEKPGQAAFDSYSDEYDDSDDITRIVIKNPDTDEITDLLSEKVIVGDEIVDQK